MSRSIRQSFFLGLPVLLSPPQGLDASAEAYDLAEACYTAALHRAPGYAIARFQLGLLQFTGGRPAAGLATWGPLDALPGDDPLRLFTTAFARLTENRLPEALDLLRAGMARNTGNAPLNDDMQRLLDRLLQAGKALEPAPDTDPEDQGPPTRHFLLSRYKQVP